MPAENSNSVFTILLVEDDMDDIMLLQAALHDNHIVYKMDVVMEGDKVELFLKDATVLPHIIVLDFNLPKKHGREILVDLKTDSKYKHIPVVVLTTSSTKEDIEYSYQNGASHFFTKPTSVNEFNSLVSILSGLMMSPEKR